MENTSQSVDGKHKVVGTEPPIKKLVPMDFQPPGVEEQDVTNTGEEPPNLPYGYFYWVSDMEKTDAIIGTEEEDLYLCKIENNMRIQHFHEMKDKWKLYHETQLKKMEEKLRLEYELKLQNQRLELENKHTEDCGVQVKEKEIDLMECSDRNYRIVTHLRWMIKVVVLGGEITTWKEIDLIGKMYTMNIKDTG